MLDVKLNLVNKDMSEIIGQITERLSFSQKWLAGVPPFPPLSYAINLVLMLR